MPTPLRRFTCALDIDGTGVRLDGMWRDGDRTPLVFLHGFGSTKEDFADVVHQPELDGHPVLAWDAPGCGASTIDNPGAVTIEFLAETARRVLAVRGVRRAHLIGHSMGGLTALRLATAQPDAAASFVDIEGNLAPEDCFLSRQLTEHQRATPEEFMDDFRTRMWNSRYAGSALYVAGLAAKASAAIVPSLFESMVRLSDHAPLLDDFLSLPCPRLFMYGEQNAHLTYLPRLAAAGIGLAEIPHCAHFPMYSNSTAMWHHITTHVARTLTPTV